MVAIRGHVGGYFVLAWPQTGRAGRWCRIMASIDTIVRGRALLLMRRLVLVLLLLLQRLDKRCLGIHAGWKGTARFRVVSKEWCAMGASRDVDDGNATLLCSAARWVSRSRWRWLRRNRHGSRSSLHCARPALRFNEGCLQRLDCLNF